MQTPTNSTATPVWRLQDAKAQFSAVVDQALLGVPQHITRHGKQAVVVVSEQTWQALQNSAAGRAHAPQSFLEHLLAVPKQQPGVALSTSNNPDIQPREIDFS